MQKDELKGDYHFDRVLSKCLSSEPGLIGFKGRAGCLSLNQNLQNLRICRIKKI
jgi:hypothetical protein